MVHFVSESRSLNGGMTFEGFAIWCTGTISGLKISLVNSFLGRRQMPAGNRHLRSADICVVAAGIHVAERHLRSQTGIASTNRSRLSLRK
jgi:hypothetical protein